MKLLTLLLLLPLFGWGQSIVTTETGINYRRMTIDSGSFKPFSLNIMSGNQLAAYRKPDSAWVFLNPGGAIATLESISTQYGYKPYKIGYVDSSMVRVDTIYFGYGIQKQDYQPMDSIKLDTAQLLKDGWRLPQDTTTVTYKAFCDCYEFRNSKEVWWEDAKPDTVAATIDVQFTRRGAIMSQDAFLINGAPWYRSMAPLTKGKWVKIRAYRWRISDGWNTSKTK